MGHRHTAVRHVGAPWDRPIDFPLLGDCSKSPRAASFALQSRKRG
jgi:hypothetical protein